MSLIPIPETHTLLITVSKQPTPAHTDTHISRTFAESIPRKQVRDSCHTSMHICVERMLLLTCCTETLTWPAIVPMVKAPE